MRGRPYNLDFDKNSIRLHASCGPQAYLPRLDRPPRLSALGPAETGSGPLDKGAPRALPIADTMTPVPFGLHGLSAPDQVEPMPTSSQAFHYRQVSGRPRLAATKRLPL